MSYTIHTIFIFLITTYREGYHAKICRICAAYRKTFNESVKYEEFCHVFAGTFIKGLIDYLEIPKEKIQLVPTNKKPEEGTTYTHIGAMHMNADSYFHLGVIIAFSLGENTYPEERIKFTLRLKFMDAVFHIRVLNGEDPFDKEPLKVRPENTDEDLRLVFDYIGDLLSNMFENRLQNYLRQNDELQQRGIGFCLPE